MNDDFDYESVSLLLHRAKNGCATSRDELMDQLQSYLFTIANRHSDQVLSNKLGTSDIVQQSMVHVINGFDDFRGNSHGEFKAWLKQILINEIRGLRRSYRREKRDIDREQSLDYSKNGVKSLLADPEPTPQTNAADAEQMQNMKNAIGLLPEDYQKVIRLRSLERLSFKDVGEQMQRSPDAVTKLWYRAILSLREIMNS